MSVRRHKVSHEVQGHGLQSLRGLRHRRAEQRVQVDDLSGRGTKVDGIMDGKGAYVGVRCLVESAGDLAVVEFSEALYAVR